MVTVTAGKKVGTEALELHIEWPTVVPEFQ
jgi:hypothetical protein